MSQSLESYLSHYQIHFLQTTQATGYAIWKTELEGFTIIQQCWQPQSSNGKTLIIAHGYLDHTGLFRHAIQWGLEQGYRVHCFDAPGHGLSSGEPAAIDSFDQYSKVLAQLIQQQEGDYWLLGQSTGCATIANLFLDDTLVQSPLRQPEKIIFLAPLVRSLGWQNMRWLYFSLKPFMRSIGRSFHGSSHDKDFNDFLDQADPLQCRTISLRWLGAMEEWVQKIKHLHIKNDIPLTIIQGTGDKTVDWKYNLSALQRCFPQAAIHMVPAAKHQLVNESEPFREKIQQLIFE